MSEIQSENNPARAAAPGPITPSTSLEIQVRGEGFDGYVVIDTLVEGTSAGGMRITDDLPLDEVRELAGEMSLKYALFHLPRGGAKSGLRMSSELDREQRMQALEEFGRRLKPVIDHGIYYPGMDMNCGPDELRAIYRGAGIELGAVTDTSRYTALTVYHALRATADALQISGRPVVLAIEGFGSVARHLAARLDPQEFRIRSIATIEGAVRGREAFLPAHLVAAREAHGDSLVDHLDGERTDRQGVLTDDVDILLPSSRIWAIDVQTAAALQAKAVVPIANAPYVEGTVAVLAARGITCLPGYLSNCGGVLASSLADQGIDDPQIEELFAAHYRTIVDGILSVAGKDGRTPVEVSESLARLHMPARAIPRDRSLLQRMWERFGASRRPAAMKSSAARDRFVHDCNRVQAEIVTMGGQG